MKLAEQQLLGFEASTSMTSTFAKQAERVTSTAMAAATVACVYQTVKHTSGDDFSS